MDKLPRITDPRKAIEELNDVLDRRTYLETILAINYLSLTEDSYGRRIAKIVKKEPATLTDQLKILEKFNIIKVVKTKGKKKIYTLDFVWFSYYVVMFLSVKAENLFISFETSKIPKIFEKHMREIKNSTLSKPATYEPNRYLVMLIKLYIDNITSLVYDSKNQIFLTNKEFDDIYAFLKHFGEKMPLLFSILVKDFKLDVVNLRMHDKEFNNFLNYMQTIELINLSPNDYILGSNPLINFIEFLKMEKR